MILVILVIKEHSSFLTIPSVLLRKATGNHFKQKKLLKRVILKNLLYSTTNRTSQKT